MLTRLDFNKTDKKKYRLDIGISLESEADGGWCGESNARWNVHCSVVVFFLLLSLIFLFFGFCLPKNDVIVVCCARMDVEELKTMLESHYQRVCTINDG